MKQLKFALIALLPLLLTGCWDGRDPEDRAYVITMGIDKGEDGLLVTFAPAKTTEGNAQSVYPVTADTLTAAVADADSRSSREVYLGQLRTVVFGKSLLADKAAFEAVLEENRGKHVAIVSHGGLLRVMLVAIMGMDVNFYRKTWMTNTSITTVDVMEDGRRILMTLNDKAHLEMADLFKKGE